MRGTRLSEIQQRRIHELETLLAAARSERIEIARTYDPNCDEYDYDTQVQAMKVAAQTVDAMQDLARAVGMDPEGCLADVPDRVIGELAEARATQEHDDTDGPPIGWTIEAIGKDGSIRCRSPGKQVRRYNFCEFKGEATE